MLFITWITRTSPSAAQKSRGGAARPSLENKRTSCAPFRTVGVPHALKKWAAGRSLVFSHPRLTPTRTHLSRESDRVAGNSPPIYHPFVASLKFFLFPILVTPGLRPVSTGIFQNYAQICWISALNKDEADPVRTHRDPQPTRIPEGRQDIGIAAESCVLLCHQLAVSLPPFAPASPGCFHSSGNRPSRSPSCVSSVLNMGQKKINLWLTNITFVQLLK